MKNFPFLTKSLVKRKAAAAIKEMQARREWSNPSAGEALGCCGNTIAHRTNGDDPSKQMTIYELLRSLQHDGPQVANAILALVDFEVQKKEPVPDVTCDRTKESRVLHAALALSIALADGEIKDEEIVCNRATLENAAESIKALLDRVGPKKDRA